VTGSGRDKTEARGGRASGSGAQRPFWRRDYVAFAVGVWLTTSLWILVVELAERSPAVWSERPGLGIGIGLVAPFVALVLASVFKLYLAFRGVDPEKVGEENPFLALAVGGVSIPICLGVVSILPKTPQSAFELLSMVVFFGTPAALAEFYWQWLSSRRGGDTRAPGGR